MRHGPLRSRDQINIGGYVIKAGVGQRDTDSGPKTVSAAEDPDDVEHVRTLIFKARPVTAPQTPRVEPPPSAPAAPPAPPAAARASAAPALDASLSAFEQTAPAPEMSAAPRPHPVPAPAPSNEPVDGAHDEPDGGATQATYARLVAQEKFKWRTRVRNELLKMMDLRRTDIGSMDERSLRKLIEGLIVEIVTSMEDQLPPDLDRALLRKHVLDEAVGLGPLEELLADESVTEIMVNAFDDIYVEKAGRLGKSEVTFSSNDAVMSAIERIVAPLGRRIDESSPMVDARLKDGSRVNAIIPPLALRGPCLTIRKFSKNKLEASDLVGFGAVSEPMVAFLKVAVEQRLNIIISGGTGSGKTTLLNVLSNFIPPGERIVTVEDAAELQLNQPHLVSLEARPANLEGKGEISIRELVKNCLRMRPDRIVVG
ncbi:MAG: CpaF family protein, partial [Gammaproteobacteria bacterium]|nr:CpaF family protein [Gammaproteobacteria bacterium]